MRVVARVCAFVGGLLLTGGFLFFGSMVIRGIWLPVAFCFFSSLLLLLNHGKPLHPAMPTLTTGFALFFFGFWALDAQYQFQAYREPLLFFPLTGALFTCLGIWTSRLIPVDHRRAVKWLLLGIATSCLVAYFSGKSGGAGPMIAWFESHGLSHGQALVATLWVRKSIHFICYGSTAAFMFMAAFRSRLTKPKAWRFGLGFALLLACFDELRQTNSVNRTASQWDVLLDVFGMLVFSAVVWKLLPKYELDRTISEPSSHC